MVCNDLPSKKSFVYHLCFRVNARKDTPKQRAWRRSNVGWKLLHKLLSRSASFFLCSVTHAKGLKGLFQSLWLRRCLSCACRGNTHEKSFLGCVVVVVERGNSSRCNCTTPDNVRSKTRLSPTVLRRTIQPCWEQHHPNWSRLAYRGDPKGRLHLRIYLLFVLQRNTTIGSGGGFHHGHRWRSACIGDLRMICTRSCVENQVGAVKGRSSWSGRKGVLVPSLSPWYIRWYVVDHFHSSSECLGCDCCGLQFRWNAVPVNRSGTKQRVIDRSP